MRIAVFVDDIRAETGGGYTFQEDVLAGLFQTVGSSHHSFVIYGRVANEFRAPNLEFRRVKWKSTKTGDWLRACFPCVDLLCNSLGWCSKIERDLRRNNVSCVWFLAPTYQTTETPYVCTIWDLQHRKQPWFPEVSEKGRWYFREAGYARVLARATAILTPNHVGKDEVVFLYGVPPERVLTVPHPTPAFAQRQDNHRWPEVAARHGVPERFLLYPAQFWAHKNHCNLLAALRLLLSRDGLRVPVVLVGSDKGNLKHVLSVARSYGLEKQVHHLGFIPQEDLILLYQNALALTYLTFFGPENLPPLEAFALGCPVVASRVAGADSQFADCARLVDPTDVEEIATAIKEVCFQESVRSELVRRGMTRAEQWTAVHYVQAVLKFFDDFERVRRCWA